MTSAQVSESRLYTSLLLAPVEGEQLVGYEPGQYLSLRLEIPGTEHSHARNYSLSDEPATDPVTISAANRLIGEVVQSRRRPLLGPSPG